MCPWSYTPQLRKIALVHRQDEIELGKILLCDLPGAQISQFIPAGCRRILAAGIRSMTDVVMMSTGGIDANAIFQARRDNLAAKYSLRGG